MSAVVLQATVNKTRDTRPPRGACQGETGARADADGTHQGA